MFCCLKRTAQCPLEAVEEAQASGSGALKLFMVNPLLSEGDF